MIYDRVRENFRKMRRLDRFTVCNVSLTQTLGRTITTSALTQLVVVAMLLLGGEVAGNQQGNACRNVGIEHLRRTDTVDPHHRRRRIADHRAGAASV